MTTQTSPGGIAPLTLVPRFLLAVVPVALAAILGNVATMPNIPTWYAGLVKPSFNPPNAVFGPVWGVLYLMMAAAIFRILSLPERPGRLAAIAAFYVQLALNAAWSFSFFGAHNPLLGLINIVALFAAILATIRLFRPLDTIAMWLLVPYAAWVAFASVLNFAIWRLNG